MTPGDIFVTPLCASGASGLWAYPALEVTVNAHILNADITDILEVLNPPLDRPLIHAVQLAKIAITRVAVPLLVGKGGDL